jgi:NADH-quinone oxidoreductase subunit C
MNNVEFVKELVESRFDVLKTEIIDQYQIAFEINKDDVHRVLSFLKMEGWIQLSYLSAVDWLKDNQFELVYILMNWEKPVHIQVRARIDREYPEMQSIITIFPGAKYYERECHEFFGVKFPGNPDYHKQLVLEGWDDIPPLRKDFDPRAYSDAHFPKRDYGDPFTNLNGQKSSKAVRDERKARIQAVRKGGVKK